MKSLSQIFDYSLLNNPDGSRKDHYREFLETVIGSPKLVEALAKDYFDRMYAQREIKKTKHGNQLVFTAPVRERIEQSIERRQERTAQIAAMGRAKADQLAARIRKIALLDVTMPNGKKAGDCTGAELRTFGGFWIEVSTHIKPTQVLRHHLNPSEMDNIWSRFEKKPKRSAADARHESRVSM